ncbi:MAG: glycosyltransferase family 2 protein [Acidithiobacillus sp.]|nr:glycosyltransferase family 2 protein [Acidithiobacillus sp.]
MNATESREATTSLSKHGLIIAVIPAFNEARFIASVVITARQHADVVLVVDDGSTDQTAFLAESAGAEVLRMAGNQGKGKALNAGFEYVLKHYQPAAVVMLDGDAQHDPEEIPTVVAPVLAGLADVVVGSRYLGLESAIPWWRKIGQRVLTSLTNAASGVPLTDSQSGFRAFSPRALKQITLQSRGLAAESEMQFVIKAARLRVQEVPVLMSYRDGLKRNPLGHGFQVVDAVLGLVAHRHPLLFFGMPGILSCMVGLVVGGYVIEVVQKLHVLPVGTALMAVGLLMIGILLSITGIILHSLDQFAQQLRGNLQALVAKGGLSQLTREPRPAEGARESL